METSLHRQLKQQYAGPGGLTELTLGRFRIDAVCDGELIEVQLGSLGALRRKVPQLLKTRRVRVVKPIVVERLLVRRAERGGPVVARRRSPKHGRLLDLFDELVHFTEVFPAAGLTLEVPLIEVEEHRLPGHGRRRRRRERDHVVEDLRLTRVQAIQRFRTAADLWVLVPDGLGQPFDTAQLARALGVPRALARKAAYVLHRTGALDRVGKRGNAFLYSPAQTNRVA